VKRLVLQIFPSSNFHLNPPDGYRDLLLQEKGKQVKSLTLFQFSKNYPPPGPSNIPLSSRRGPG